MNTKNRKSTNVKRQKPMTIEELKEKLENLFKEIHDFVSNGNYIFRGESKEYNKISSKEYGKVSSTLYRELRDYMKSGEFDIEEVQKTRMKDAQKHTKEEKVVTILEQTQHFGGSTNQIDFTTDYLIALFFACDGEHKKNGKLIFLDKDEFKEQIHEPSHPQNRVIAQKSVFVNSPSGLIEVNLENTIAIDKKLKPSILHYLRQHHDISPHTIYNDIHGYITRSKIHKLARKNFYKGFRYYEAEDDKLARKYYKISLKHDPVSEGAYNNLGSVYNRMKKYNLAIDSFNKAIALDSNYAMAYNNRGNAYRGKGDYYDAIANDKKSIANHKKAIAEYNKAIVDFNKAIELNSDFIKAYGNRSIAKKALKDIKGAREDLETALRLAEQQRDKALAAEIQKEINKLAELEK